MAGIYSREWGSIWFQLRPYAGVLVVAWVIFSPTFAHPGYAESASGTAATEAPEVAGPADDYDRGVPQTSMQGFLLAARAGDYDRAANYLDLRRFPKAVREAQGSQLARQLKVVLDRTLWVDIDALSADPRGDERDGLPANRELAGRIETKQGKVDVMLQRVPRADGVLVWKISSTTVQRIPQLYQEFGYGRLGDLLPAPFIEIHFLEIRLWQWIGLLALVFAAGLVGWLGVGLFIRALGRLLGRLLSGLESSRLSLARGPLRLLVAVLVFSAGTLSLRLAVSVQNIISRIESVLLIFAFAWLALRAVDLATEIVRRRLIQRAQEQATSLLPPGRKTAKAIVVAIAAIAMLNSLGFNVTALVAGLGVGGIAVALAAQKSLENLLGGINLYVDQPVRVGDFCRFGDKLGTIEDIGMRSTRIRTLDRTVISIANAEFSSLQIENFSKRDKIWYHPRIGLRYETTPDQIRYILVETRKMLYAHPRVDPDPARIRFVNFGAYSLDLDIFAYVRATDYGEFLEVAEDLNLRIMEIVERAGSGFAFPSQTTYVESGEGLNTERARSAEAEVQRWREQNELCLPGFPRRTIDQLRGTLDYPPKGSAAGSV